MTNNQTPVVNQTDVVNQTAVVTNTSPTLPPVGTHHRFRDFYEVGREKVREYARAVQDLHPAHWSEEAATELGHDTALAPLTFVAVLGLQRMFDEILTGYDLSQVLHTDQTFEFHQPLKVGDRLVCDCYLDSFRQMAGTDIVRLKNVVSNQDGQLLQTAYTTIVARTHMDVDNEISEAVQRIMMQSTHL